MKIQITNTETFAVLFLDVLRVDFSPEASITEHPVEIGANVTDHTQVRPYRFTVEAIATASPRGVVPAPLAIDNAIMFLEGALGKLVTAVIDGVGTFTSYTIEAFPYSVTTRKARVFSIRFKQIRIASSVTVTIPPRTPAPVAATGAPSAQGLGQQAAVAAPESLLSAAANLLGF